MRRVIDFYTKHMRKEESKRTRDLEDIFSIIRSLSKRDMRVGQIMVNIVLSDHELFYMENGELLEALKTCYGKML